MTEENSTCTESGLGGTFQSSCYQDSFGSILGCGFGDGNVEYGDGSGYSYIETLHMRMQHFLYNKNL